VYNGAATLNALVERLQPVLAQLVPVYELILVDDASVDDSWSIVRQLRERHAWIRGVRLMRNFGQHNATLCGIREARYDAIVTMDDDLQNPPEQIPVLIAELERGYDVVYGAPVGKTHERWRRLASHVTRLALQSVLGAETARDVSAFRVFRTPLRGAFADFRGAFVSIDVLLTWGATRFSACRVPYDVRRAGRSNYTFGKLLRLALNMTTGFSTLPLQLASVAGFAATALGFALFAFVLIRYLIHGVTVPGFAFLASVICIFSGIQLFTLGIFGEYLARIHSRTMERPVYAIAERTPAGALQAGGR
jgi:glycosyltransferase involved in cell wall biosynthesis